MTQSSTAPSARSKLLIVDDDASLLRALARAVNKSRRGISVTTAGSASEAIDCLQNAPVDVVLSDLQMPAMDGFELIAWMLKNTPQTPVFAMTAYWSPSAEDKLGSLGGVECFTKPLDVTSVMGRIDEVLAAGVRGHIQNMSTPSLLQIISMDRKTCTLLMSTRDKSGHLFIHKGEVVDARTGDLRGEGAALTILSWPFPTITIDSRCKFTERTVHQPLTYIIMEAMRLADEQARLDEAAGALRGSSPPSRRSETPPRRSETPPSSATQSAPEHDPPRNTDLAASRITQTSLTTMKALGLALVAADGRLLSSAAQSSAELGAMARLASTMLAELHAVQARQSGAQQIEELVFTASDLCQLVKPIGSPHEAFVLMVFNPRDTSLATRRTDLEKLMQTLQA